VVITPPLGSLRADLPWASPEKVDTEKGRIRYTGWEGNEEMKDRHYRTYTDEFKREALELLKNSEKSAGQLERELGITPGMLLKWRSKYQVVTNERETPRLEPSDLEAAKREIQHLQRELREMAEEREILKKVVSIFSKKGA
jgi:transposase